jgi:hypothetical protein
MIKSNRDKHRLKGVGLNLDREYSCRLSSIINRLE